MEKVQSNSIDKKQNTLKYSKNDKSSTLPHPSDDHERLRKINTVCNFYKKKGLSTRPDR